MSVDKKSLQKTKQIMTHLINQHRFVCCMDPFSTGTQPHTFVSTQHHLSVLPHIVEATNTAANQTNSGSSRRYLTLGLQKTLTMVIVIRSHVIGC